MSSLLGGPIHFDSFDLYSELSDLALNEGRYITVIETVIMIAFVDEGRVINDDDAANCKSYICALNVVGDLD